MNSDVTMSDARHDIEDDEEDLVSHFVVAVDFGTAFSSVAYARYTHEHQRRYIEWDHIQMIDRYPDGTDSNALINDVPTEIWYPPPGQRQDGTNSFHSPEQTDNSGFDSADEEPNSESDTESANETQRSEVPAAPSNSGATPNLFWGYGVQRQIQIADIFDGSKRIDRFKLLLHHSRKTEKARHKLEDVCGVLRKMRLIELNTDLIAHYLEKLFVHTRTRLIVEGYTERSKIEFVLCVPAIWKAKACRQMHAAMGTAIEKSGFGSLQNKSIDNLFIVSEPEAAATYAIQSEKIQFQMRETVTILDAGGATVDAATYSVDDIVPLRFKTEVVELGGDLCGSSYINERFEDLLLRRIGKETYLSRDGEDMSRVIDRLVVEFERYHKRALDAMFPNNVKRYNFPVEGLWPNNRKRFSLNRMLLTRTEIRFLFQPSAERVAEIMEEQIDAARNKVYPSNVKKVVLLGGYGQSASLQAHLRKVLSDKPKYKGIVLLTPNLMSTAVSQGAVLRALRKDEGPNRVLQSSYGFLRTERYMDNEEFHQAHSLQAPWRDKLDGLDYIEDTGSTIAAEMRFDIDVEYTFPLNQKRLDSKETLVVWDGTDEGDSSDTENNLRGEVAKCESHYRYSHPKNAGAEILGYVEFDVTDRKGTDMVKTMPPGAAKFPYWKAFAKLTVIVNGRNLRYEVRLRDESDEVNARGTGQESLAVAFKPGTE